MRIFLFRIFCFLLLHGFAPSLHAQVLFNIVNSPLDTIACDSTCITIQANLAKPLHTNQYSSLSIPFAPLSIPTGTNLSLGDDMFSGAVPIGFPFCFYEQQYTQLYASANGHVTFNPNYSNTSCSFDTKKPMPFYNAAYPDNAIFCPFMDGNTAIGGTIQYATQGTAPFRKFVIEYNSIPFFGPTCSNATSTFQLILFETLNSMEVHISNKSICDADTSKWLNFATLGIQSTGGSNFHIVNGRNATIWTASNEGWRINPSGANAYNIKWYSTLTGLLPQFNDQESINVCNTLYPKKYYAKYTTECPAQVVWDTITIVKLTPIIDSVHITPTSCKNTFDGSLTVYATGFAPPVTYSIAYGPYTSNNVFTNLSYGIKVISIKDANGCVKDTLFNIPSLSNLTVTIDSINLPDCPLNNGVLHATASGGVLPYTYTWGTGTVGQTDTGIAPGVNYVIVQDANGCRDSVGINVVFEHLPFVTAIITKPICGDSSGGIDITVTDGTPGYTYSWSNSATSQDLSGIPAGNYSVTVTDTNGCYKVKYFSVLDTLTVHTLRDSIKTICGKNNGKLSVIPSNSIAPYTYSWSNGCTAYIDSNLAPGSYICFTTAANGCVKKDSFYVAPSVAINLQLFPANAHCDSINGAINSVVSNTTGAFTYAWSTGSNANSISGLAPNIYWLIITDSLGCKASDTVLLGDDGVPYLQIVNYTAPLCHGDSNGSITLTGYSGVAPYKYSLDGITFTTTAQINTISGGTYTIYIRDANSCVTDTTITFTEPSALVTISIPPDTLACFDDKTSSIIIQTSGGFSPYLYNINNQGWQSANTFNGLGAGTYTVEIKDSNNCLTNEIVDIIGPTEPLNIDLQKRDVPCFETNTGWVQGSISGGWIPYFFHWNNSNTSLILDSIIAGNYQLIVHDERGCAITKSITVDQQNCCTAYLPNAFTPDGDTKNETYGVITLSNVDQMHLQIFNRWGTVVFNAHSLSERWDGRYGNEEAPIGTYFYLLEYKCPWLDKKVVLKGDLTLIR